MTPPDPVSAALKRLQNSLRDFALGKLAGSPDPHALEVLDHVADSTGVTLDFARLMLARRLAAAIVLARLPADIASASMVFEEEVFDESDAVPP